MLGQRAQVCLVATSDARLLLPLERYFSQGTLHPVTEARSCAHRCEFTLMSLQLTRVGLITTNHFLTPISHLLDVGGERRELREQHRIWNLNRLIDHGDINTHSLASTLDSSSVTYPSSVFPPPPTATLSSCATTAGTHMVPLLHPHPLKQPIFTQHLSNL